jgi:hypothetical protein
LSRGQVLMKYIQGLAGMIEIQKGALGTA